VPRSKSQDNLAAQSLEAAKSLAAATKAIKERDAATAKLLTAEERAEAAAATARKTADAKVKLQAAMQAAEVAAAATVERYAAQAKKAQESEASTAEALNAKQRELEGARAELEEGRMVAAELYGELNDLLEKEQNVLTTTQGKLAEKNKEVAATQKALFLATAKSDQLKEAAVAAQELSKVEQARAEKAEQEVVAVRAAAAAAAVTQADEITAALVERDDALLRADKAEEMLALMLYNRKREKVKRLIKRVGQFFGKEIVTGVVVPSKRGEHGKREGVQSVRSRLP